MIDATSFAYGCYKGTESSQGVSKGLWSAQKVTMVALEVIVIGAALAAYFYFGTGFAIPALLGALIASYELASLAKTIIFQWRDQKEGALKRSSKQTNQIGVSLDDNIAEVTQLDHVIQELQDKKIIINTQNNWECVDHGISFAQLENVPAVLSKKNDVSIMPSGDFIASYPSLKQTFWLTVVQENITTLVRFVDDKGSHDSYWPKQISTSIKYGEHIKLTLKSEDTSNTGVVVRTFDLVAIVNGSRLRKTVTQHEFASLTDTDGNILDVVIDLTENDQLGKVLIQGDRGIGPSGVFYALRLLDQIGWRMLKGEIGGLQVNLPQFVNYLRSFHPGIIETQAEYALLASYINNTM